MAASIQVSGLSNVRAGLKKMEDATSSGDVKKAFHDAADLVAVRARGKVPSRSGRAAGSIKAGASGKGAYVKGGGGKVPYYGWLEFGTRTPKRGNPRSRGPWSGSGKGPAKGRFIYPAIDENQEKILELVGKGLESLIKKVGLG